MSRKLDIKKGDTVYVKIEEMSNAARRVKMSMNNIDEWLFEGVVVSVGRKYITVKWNDWKEAKFSIEKDYREHYTCGGADYKLYANKQEVLDEKESDIIYSQIREKFSVYRNNHKLSLDQLKRIREIIEE